MVGPNRAPLQPEHPVVQDDVKQSGVSPSPSALSQLHLWQRFHVRLTLLYAAATVVIVGLLTGLAAREMVQQRTDALRMRLVNTVTALSATVDGDAVAALEPADPVITPLHTSMKAAFAAVGEVDPTVLTIYALRATDDPDTFHFVVDWTRSGRHGQVGEAYDASEVPVLKRGMDEIIAEKQLYSDAFGTSLSAYAPLRRASGESIGIIGVDVDAAELKALRREVLMLALGTFGLAGLLLAGAAAVVARSVRGPLMRMIEATTDISRGKLDVRLALDRSDEFGLLAHHFDAMADGLSEREHIRETFGRYVSEDVAIEILRGGQAPRLGGAEVELTVLFSDLRGYSTLAEQLDPKQIVGLLNRYLTAMNTVIDANGGCPIEYLGDAIMVVFGAPNEDPDHPANAVRCALDMVQALDQLNAQLVEEGLGHLWDDSAVSGLGQRIGVHTGRVVAGNVGSPQRMKYTVIGDDVNVAARLEQLNKELDSEICISGAVYQTLPQALKGRATHRGAHQVKGREEEVEVYVVS